MKRAMLWLMAALTVLSACGIRRPIMRPNEIPKYEAKRAQRMKRFGANSNDDTGNETEENSGNSAADGTTTDSPAATPANPNPPGEAQPQNGLVPATRVP